MPPEREGAALDGARRILVMRPDNLGDVVLTGPLFRALRSAAPDAALGLFASPAGALAAPLLPWVDEVVEWRPVWQDLGARLPQDPERELALVERLRSGRWDAVLIATSFRQTGWPAAYAAYLAGIPRRVGFAGDFGGSLLTDQVDPPPIELHQAERNLVLVRAIGVPVAEDALEIRVPEAARVEIRRRLDRRGIRAGEPIVLVPGASAAARRYPAHRWADAAREVAAAADRPVVVATTPRERPVLEAVLRAAPGAITLGDDLSVPQFAALIEAAGLVLCGNSLALHLADALRRPVGVAYAGTDLVPQWQPRRTRSVLLQRPVACSPCYLIDCPIGQPCLDVAPSEIADAAARLLAGPTPRARRGTTHGGVACAA